jgi:F0F1-type ATP synthase membrane subunit b/b'
LQNTLRTRKQDIIKKIQDVKESYEQSQNKLIEARLCLEEAIKKKAAMYASAEIEKQRQQTIFKETVSDMKQRFKNAKDASIRLEIQQIRQEVCETISISALKRAKDAMGTRITPEMQRRIIDYKIGILNSIK